MDKEINNKYIGVNGTILFPGRSDGFARVTRETIKELLLRKVPIKIFSNNAESFRSYNRVNSPQVISQPNMKGNLTRLLWHQMILPKIIKKNKDIRLYYSPTHDGMLNPVCPQITTIYDLIPLHYPEDSPRFKYYYRYIVPRLIKASAYTIAGSKSTLKDIERIFFIKENIKVIYPGYNKEVFKEQTKTQVEQIKNKYNLNDYLLYAGEIRPYKNVKGLIAAYTLLKNHSVKLVIVGRITKLSQDMASFVKGKNQVGDIRLLGYVPDDDLASLYAGAKAFVFPSLYEGFGLPPLEAMACGCPAMISNVSSLPEVCGPAGYYFDPYNPEDIAKAIATVLDKKELRQEMAFKGLYRAKEFSFGKTADSLMKLFGELCR